MAVLFFGFNIATQRLAATIVMVPNAIEKYNGADMSAHAVSRLAKYITIGIIMHAANPYNAIDSFLLGLIGPIYV